MRDGNQTGYAPTPIAGVTPDQRIAVASRSTPCDGESATPGLGHPRIWLRINPGQDSVTCPYCSITYVLQPGAGDGDHH
jgi:uncharacterized Zn-finger protein